MMCGEVRDGQMRLRNIDEGNLLCFKFMFNLKKEYGVETTPSPKGEIKYVFLYLFIYIDILLLCIVDVFIKCNNKRKKKGKKKKVVIRKKRYNKKKKGKLKNGKKKERKKEKSDRKNLKKIKIKRLIKKKIIFESGYVPRGITIWVSKFFSLCVCLKNLCDIVWLNVIESEAWQCIRVYVEASYDKWFDAAKVLRWIKQIWQAKREKISSSSELEQKMHITNTRIIKEVTNFNKQEGQQLYLEYMLFLSSSVVVKYIIQNNVSMDHLVNIVLNEEEKERTNFTRFTSTPGLFFWSKRTVVIGQVRLKGNGCLVKSQLKKKICKNIEVITALPDERLHIKWAQLELISMETDILREQSRPIVCSELANKKRNTIAFLYLDLHLFADRSLLDFNTEDLTQQHKSEELAEEIAKSTCMLLLSLNECKTLPIILFTEDSLYSFMFVYIP
ncbi:hypothetical protein RFI_27525 [Reticulomyxa filosa]|uniref:Uncharacterized protein n=1 Tax=Reticulomyxa filosa TaxID=46433 RepID=X6M782_RETFI|nr:hypothetical protein RFI_27525 [Reticulomyxa filosa]|eukprot:ETO09853.1 hypothetical protein RFI_27525 [Reticulomyxa filosa]